jgi:hypothetical protein
VPSSKSNPSIGSHSSQGSIQSASRWSDGSFFSRVEEASRGSKQSWEPEDLSDDGSIPEEASSRHGVRRPDRVS